MGEVFEDDDEFIPAISSNQCMLFSDDLPARLSKCLDHFISHKMSISVIDCFEVVHIEYKTADCVLSFGQPLVAYRFEMMTRTGAGQGIGVGPMLNCRDVVLDIQLPDF